MSRENRFSDTSLNCSSRRRLSVEKVKEIFIQNVTNGDKRSLNIIMKKTVKDLKKEIEKLFGLDYSLDAYSLRVQTSSITGEKLIPPEDETKSLFDNGFTARCIVFFGNIEISIENVTNKDTRSLNIAMNKTVKDLKKEIENLFGLDYSLDNISLRVQTSSINGQTLIPPEDEQKSLFDNGFTPICEVFFGKDENVGGTFNSFK